MASLIIDKADRLSSRRYKLRDIAVMSSSGETSSSRRSGGSKDLAGRYVFPYDGEDIKAHKWFRGVPWARLHELPPPFIPHLRTADDTQYFDDEDGVSD